MSKRIIGAVAFAAVLAGLVVPGEVFAQGGTWATKAPMPTPRTFVQVEAINGILYVAGGLNGADVPILEAYNPATNTWTSLPAMPDIGDGSPGRYQGAVAVINGKLAVIGGWHTSPGLPTRTPKVFDPGTNSWNTLASMPTSSGCGAAGVTGGKVYVTTPCNGYDGYRQFLHVYDPATLGWARLSDSPAIHVNPVGAGINGKFYLAGGHNGSVQDNRLDVYDPVGNFWVTKISMPIKLDSAAGGASNGTLYVAGGYDGVKSRNELQAYDTAADTWTLLAPMPTARYGAGGAVINGKLYVVGGGNAGGPLGTLEVFTPTAASLPTLTSIAVTPANPAITVGQTQQFTATGTFSDGSARALTGGAGTWATKSPMPTARGILGADTINGIVYAVGGHLGGCSFTSALEAYNPATDTWTTKAPMLTARSYPAVGVINGILYAAGGDLGCDPNTNAVEAYNPASNAWTAKAPLPVALRAAGVGVVNGILLVVGGYSTSSGILSTTYAYNPIANTWTTKAAMPTARAAHAAAVVNGILYVVGGTSNSGDLATVEAYDSVADSWSTKAPLLTARNSHSAVVVNGILYVIGGANATGVLATVEAFDPVSNTWTPRPAMPTARQWLAASTVNGVLYALGGTRDGGISAYSNNEAFTPGEVTWSTGNTSIATVSATGLATANATAAGSSTISATSAGVSGNTILTVISSDTIAPTTTASASPPANGAGWNNANVTVTLTAIDDAGDSGVRVLAYTSTLNGSTVGNSVPAGMTSLLISADGTTTVTYHATDVAGNVEAVRTIVVRLDKTPPVLSYPLQQQAAATSSAGAVVNFGVSASDVSSGLVGPVTVSPLGSGALFPVGTTHETVTATDAAGNVATGTFDVIVNPWDTTPPTTTIQNLQPANENGWYRFNVPLSLNASDSGGAASPSGVQSISYTLAGAHTGGGTFIGNNTQVTITAEGTTTVTYHATDFAGNVEADHTLVINLDKTQPSVANLPNLTVQATSGAGAVVTFTVAATDASSGVGTVTVTQGLASGTTFPLGTTNETVSVTDLAGNTTTRSFSVTVNKTLVSIAVTPPTASTHPGHNGVQFTATGTYSDQSTQVLLSGGGGGGGNVRPGFLWQVHFLAAGIDVSACATAQYAAPIGFSSQVLINNAGAVHETWSPGTPVVTVDGTINATDVVLTLACTNAAATGTVAAHWTGTRYEGSFSFNNGASIGQLSITGWSRKGNAPTRRFAHAAASVNGFVYLIGGGNDTEFVTAIDVYHPVNDAWTTLPPSSSLPTSREGLGAAAVGNSIYAIGGHVAGGIPSGLLEIYDTAQGTWTTGAPMPTPRAHLAVVSDGTYVYAIGGDTQGNSGLVATVERYDPSANTWSTLAPMPAAGSFIAAGVLNGTIVVVGSGDGGGPSARTDVYDIASGTWHDGAAMPAARGLMAIGVSHGGLFVFGGTINGSPAYDTWVYYPARNSRPDGWSGVGSIPTARMALAAAVVDEVVYAIGGSADSSGGSSSLMTNEALSTPPLGDLLPSQGASGGGSNSPTVRWQSTNTTVADVDANGLANAHTLGLTTIVASLGNISGQATLTVTNAAPSVQVTGVLFGPGPVPLFAPGPFIVNETGNLLQLVAEVLDPDNDQSTLQWSIVSGPGTLGSQFGGITSSSVTYNPADGPSVATVQVTATDSFGAIGVSTTTITVNNIAPTVQIFGDPFTVNEGQNVAAGANFFDPGANDGPWTVTVDYGDGTPVQTPSYTTSPGGGLGMNGNFQLNHTYVDNGHYTITVSATDKEHGTGTATAQVTVNNVAPRISGPNSSSTQVGSTNSFGCASFSDAGALDGPWTATVDYGDGTGPKSVLPVIPSTCGGGNNIGSITLSHPYPTASGFTVNVSVTDKDGGVNSFRFAVNVNKGTTSASLVATPVNSNEHDTVTFTATVQHPAGTAVPTGTVTFKENGITFATPPLDGTGQATTSTNTLRAGSHSITASYGGDANFTSSFSCSGGGSCPTITVADITPPTLFLPSNITADGPDATTSITVNFNVTANDAVSGSRPVTCTPASGSLFPVGTTTVSCSASDARGNTATGSFTVKVRGLVSLNTQTNTGENQATLSVGQSRQFVAHGTFTDGCVKGTDNSRSGECGPASSGDGTGVGTGGPGNLVATGRSDTQLALQWDANGNTQFTVDYLGSGYFGGAQPTCSAFPEHSNIFLTSSDPVTVAGLQPLTWYHIHVHALSGNRTVGGATNVIIVRTRTAGSVSEQLSPGSPDYIVCGSGGGSGDGGGGGDQGPIFRLLDPVTRLASAVGSIVPDATGAAVTALTPGTALVVVAFGTASCLTTNTCATLTVPDTTPPTITAPGNLIVNTDAGKSTASDVVLGTPTTSDNVGVANVTNDAPARFPLGTTTVMWMATDAAGNSASAPQTVTVRDVEPPSLTFGAPTPIANAAGWNNTDVSIAFTTADNAPGVVSASVPSPLMWVVDGTGLTRNITLTDAAGNTATFSSPAVSVDKTAPLVTYGGGDSAYAVDQTVSILCSASDGGSGVASTTCADIAGPAYSFAVGVNSYSADATDRAGNVGHGSTSFTVTVTTSSLAALVNGFSSNAGVASGLNAKLSAAASAPNSTARAGQLNAFENLVSAQTGKALTANQAAILLRLVASLR